jgi:hypothetical protein
MPPSLLPRTCDRDKDDESMIDDCEEKSVNTTTSQVVIYDHKRDMEEWLIDSGATVNVTRSEKNVTNSKCSDT